MATLGYLTGKVREAITDTSITDASIQKALNNGLNFVASSVLLPPLESEGFFVSNPTAYSVSIPASWNFGRNLYYASYAGRKVHVFPSLAHLTRKHGISFDEIHEGSICYLTTVGSTLKYYRTPASAVTVNCKFYAKPAALEDPADEPWCIEKEEYHELLLVNYVLWHAWSLKEDGMEGLKVNTEYHKNLFMDTLQLLDNKTITGVSTPDLDRTTSWI